VCHSDIALSLARSLATMSAPARSGGAPPPSSLAALCNAITSPSPTLHKNSVHELLNNDSDSGATFTAEPPSNGFIWRDKRSRLSGGSVGSSSGGTAGALADSDDGSDDVTPYGWGNRGSPSPSASPTLLQHLPPLVDDHQPPFSSTTTRHSHPPLNKLNSREQLAARRRDTASPGSPGGTLSPGGRSPSSVRSPLGSPSISPSSLGRKRKHDDMFEPPFDSPPYAVASHFSAPALSSDEFVVSIPPELAEEYHNRRLRLQQQRQQRLDQYQQQQLMQQIQQHAQQLQLQQQQQASVHPQRPSFLKEELDRHRPQTPTDSYSRPPPLLPSSRSSSMPSISRASSIDKRRSGPSGFTSAASCIASLNTVATAAAAAAAAAAANSSSSSAISPPRSPASASSTSSSPRDAPLDNALTQAHIQYRLQQLQQQQQQQQQHQQPPQSPDQDYMYHKTEFVSPPPSSHSHTLARRSSSGSGDGHEGNPFILVIEDPTQPRPKKRRANLPKHVTNLLVNWLFEHSALPYPTEDQKQELMQQTNLTRTQVRINSNDGKRRAVAMRFSM